MTKAFARWLVALLGFGAAFVAPYAAAEDADEPLPTTIVVKEVLDASGRQVKAEAYPIVMARPVLDAVSAEIAHALARRVKARELPLDFASVNAGAPEAIDRFFRAGIDKKQESRAEEHATEEQFYPFSAYTGYYGYMPWWGGRGFGYGFTPRYLGYFPYAPYYYSYAPVIPVDYGVTPFAYSVQYPYTAFGIYDGDVLIPYIASGYWFGNGYVNYYYYNRL